MPELLETSVNLEPSLRKRKIRIPELELDTMRSRSPSPSKSAQPAPLPRPGTETPIWTVTSVYICAAKAAADASNAEIINPFTITEPPRTQDVFVAVARDTCL